MGELAQRPIGVPCVSQSDEVGDERGVRTVAALVSRDAGEIEQERDVALRELEGSRLLADLRGKSGGGVVEPVAHRTSLEHGSGRRPPGHGHWAYGATDIVIDGDTVKGDERRAGGFHGNAVMRLDPHLGDVTLSDLTGGSAVFYDTGVRLERATERESIVLA